jgi:hypothetical protein
MKIIINSSKLYIKSACLLYIISIFEILVYFGKENSMKLDKLTAFIKLGNEFILKKRIIL